MLLEKIRKENEVKSKTSVAIIIPIDVDEEEDRKKLIAKLEKQKEILDLLDEEDCPGWMFATLMLTLFLKMSQNIL